VDEDGNADYQNVDVLQELGVATLELMKGVQDDVHVGEAMGDCNVIFLCSQGQVWCEKEMDDRKLTAIFLL